MPPCNKAFVGCFLSSVPDHNVPEQQQQYPVGAQPKSFKPAKNRSGSLCEWQSLVVQSFSGGNT
jgi:hypothetical protein